MLITSRSECFPVVNPSGESVVELIGSAPGHGEASQHSLAYIIIPPGKCSVTHYHQIEEETYYVLFGKGKIIVDGEVSHLIPGQACLIMPGERHQIYCDGDIPLEFLAVCAPPWSIRDHYED